MANDLITNPQTKPEWLTRSLDAVKGDYLAPRIAESISLTPQQRKFVETEIQNLKRLENDISEIESAKIITRLLNAFPSQVASPTAAADRNEAYLIAVEDLPYWAVEAAYRSWVRGEAQKKDYIYAPTPPQLRNTARDKLSPIIGYRLQLEKLLNAKVEKTFSDEYRQTMLQRIRALFWEPA